MQLAMVIIWLIASFLGAVLYRLGGTSAGTKWRDMGVPAVATLYLLTPGLKSQIWGIWGLVAALVVHFGLLFGSLTTYWKRKGNPARWWNWALCGLGYGLSALPLAFATGHWLGFGIRLVGLPALIALWSVNIDQDWIEEGGRGAAIIATLPLLII